MRKIIFLILIFFQYSLSFSQNNENTHNQHPNLALKDTIKGSPHKIVKAEIGSMEVVIEYNSPGVRNRIIWGGLVPYNDVWVTGAHYATSIYLTDDVYIADKFLPKGKYAFFTIPGKEKWILIFNRNWRQHLADDYDPSLDVLRFEVVPEKPENPVERLTYEVTKKNKKSGIISMAWENVKIGFLFEVDED